MGNLKRYEGIFEELFSVTPNMLDENFTFANVEKWDSVTHLVLISILEETFSVLYETADILQYGSYLNGIEILRRYGVEI